MQYFNKEAELDWDKESDILNKINGEQEFDWENDDYINESNCVLFV